ncbi:MAG: DUF364 domain-containing protein [Eubacteriales bacterium]|nr:DUF364 domain-containing protein [Eubacteriales bacterium]
MNSRTLYDELIASIPNDIYPEAVHEGPVLCGVRTADSMGVAMNFEHVGRPRIATSYEGMSLRALAELSLSWHMKEAAVGVAALNAYWNTPALLTHADAGAAFEHYRTEMAGKRIAVIGHFPYIDKLLGDIADVITLERENTPGDYPDSACEFVLEDRDVIFMTGSAFVNKTAPRLLALCQGKEIILTGPTTPMSPLLYGYGVTGLSGFVVTDFDGATKEVTGGDCLGIFRYGTMVNLKR